MKVQKGEVITGLSRVPGRELPLGEEELQEGQEGEASPASAQGELEGQLEESQEGEEKHAPGDGDL